MLDWCISKLNEVAQDLREPQDGSDLEHQASKLDRVIEKLRKVRGPTSTTEVHGGGTGND